MKKIISVFLVIVLLILCTSCGEDFYKDSLEEYKKRTAGYSKVEIDSPSHTLPSATFITDFNYIDGKYRFYEPLLLSSEASISLLWLKYEPDTYSEAKEYTLKHLPMYGDFLYTYGDYVFYENEIFYRLKENGRSFPECFSMVCYNDVENSLIFIGYYDEDAKASDVEDWCAFIDKYYGKYHKFSSEV